jgi:hypothetical protein
LGRNHKGLSRRNGKIAENPKFEAKSETNEILSGDEILNPKRVCLGFCAFKLWICLEFRIPKLYHWRLIRTGLASFVVKSVLGAKLPFAPFAILDSPSSILSLCLVCGCRAVFYAIRSQGPYGTCARLTADRLWNKQLLNLLVSGMLPAQSWQQL